MTKAKIIFFLRALEMGGVERVVSELSFGLSEEMEKIIVLFTEQATYPYKFNGRVISLGLPSNSSLLFKLYYFIVGIFRLRRLIKNEKPNYVVSFGFKPNIINIFSSGRSILRVDHHMSAGPMVLYKLMAKVFFNLARKIICVSKLSAKDLVDNFNVREEKIKVIYNPISNEKISSSSEASIEPQYLNIFNKPVVMHIGRLTEQKGQRYLVRSFGEVKKIIHDAQLVILGEQGELGEELKQLVADLKIQGSVHFLGWQGNPFKFLAKSKVFVLSSLWEGLPYVIIEAMACGLPVISSDCKSGPREILAPSTDISQCAEDIEYAEYGILTPAFSGKKLKMLEPLEKSEEKLRDAMVKILTDDQMHKRMSKKSLDRAQAFDVTNIIKEWDFLKNN